MTAPTPGVKNFAYLEILEDYDIDNYLMSQAIPRFNLEADRDAAMPAPVEGQFCYVSSLFMPMWFDGATWLPFAGPEGPQGPPGTPSPVNSVAGRDGDVVLTKADVGLSSVDDTADAAKPVSAAQQAALDLKAPLASPTFTGTVTGVSKAAVGLSNVDNTSDANKPVSTAQAAADALKVSKAGDTMTGALALPAGAAMLTFGADVNLYRSAANVLKTDDALHVTGALTGGSYAYYTFDAYFWNGAAGQSRVGYIFSGPSAPASGTGVPGIEFGLAADTNLYRSAANTLGTDDDFAILNPGKGLKVKEGANAKMGATALTAGTVTVATTAVTANSRIFLTSQVDGGTPGWLRVSARTAGTQFIITSSSPTDTSTVAWLIVEPA